MKVMIVNAYSSKGGASRAARRLEACLSVVDGIEVEYLALIDGDGALYGDAASWVRAATNRAPGYLFSKGQAFFSTPILSSRKVVDYINESDCDIVNLHWINSGAIGISDISKMNKPIVWSLHDMWPFTGGCHYDQNCKGYKSRCSTCCKVIGNALGTQLASSFFEKKEESYKKHQSLTFVGLSKWMAAEAASSSLSNLYKVVNLPNPIDTDIFHEISRVKARERFGLPVEKQLVLFGSMSVDDPRKGLKELMASIAFLRNDDVELVVFGASDSLESTIGNNKIHYVGSLGLDSDLAQLYSACDVMVVPSLQENLSNAIMESMSCSTPVVAFDIGGNPDLIDHKVNGYLATPLDVKDLAWGIEFILSTQKSVPLRQAARDKVVTSFSNSVVAKKYMNLFDRVVKEWSA